jgi:hypothetical protein
MNHLQQKLISTYKEIFPKDTYKDISNKTRIQQTRVFRIFNGSEMKLSEYEVIEGVTKDTKPSLFDLRKVIRLCEKTFSFDEIGELLEEINYKLEIKGALQ